MDAKMHLTTDQLRQRFQFHPPRDNVTADKHDRVRSACLDAAEELVKATGAVSREQSLAITKLEEAMFWANAAIAREVGS
jgi:hypothetical protein